MLELQIVMGRGLMVWQRFLVPEVAGSNPAVPAKLHINIKDRVLWPVFSLPDKYSQNCLAADWWA
jgi:hypothetical protein